MVYYYGAVASFSCFALVLLIVLVYENSYFDRDTKNRFYQLYVLLIMAALAEMGAVLLNGAPSVTKPLHALIKALDYVLTPIAAYFFGRQVARGKTAGDKIMAILLTVNGILALLSVHFGWYFYIDADNCYHHGALFAIYVLIYLTAFAQVVNRLYGYGKHFRKGNRMSLLGIVILVCAGIIIQEVISSDIRTVTIALTLAAILIYIHINEFSEQAQEENIRQTVDLLRRDTLTNMMNRFSYNEALELYGKRGKLDDDFVAVAMDVNSLKNINDTLGHLAGDELIYGASVCILNAMSAYGKCFRVGGDEFVALLNAGKSEIDSIKKCLEQEMSEWHGKLVDHVSISVGFAAASEQPGISLERLVKMADERMYRTKAEYYSQKGLDRRASRTAYNAICDSYTKILLVDLEADQYEIIRMDREEMTEEKGYSKTISGWLRNFAESGQVHPEDRADYITGTDIRVLQKYFLEGKKEYYLFYRRKFGDRYRRVMMELIAEKEYTEDNQLVYLYVKEIER